MSSNNKIILKRSSVAGKKPTADQLDYGEISLNYADGEVYYKSSKNEIKALGEQYASEIETLKSGKLDKTETPMRRSTITSVTRLHPNISYHLNFRIEVAIINFVFLVILPTAAQRAR